ncbi:MAG TPA: condensation domain-containing protein, partial [Thermoanaerobaculia bacterium]|nr:condensation domain-containing protein [Thermoanaerobaculia bacterium]
LPRLPNGKVDRGALPDPGDSDPEASGEPGELHGAVEEVLAGIWQDVLGLDRRVGPGEDFFALGGHSLVATQVVSRVRASLRVELPLQDLFRRPTPRALAAAVEELRRRASGAGAEPLRPEPREGEPPLSFAQQRLWFLEQLQPGTAVYNVPTSARLLGELSPAPLARALAEVVRRHEVLRTEIPTVGGRPQPVVRARVRVPMPLVDLRALPPDRREAEARCAAGTAARRPLDLARAPLFRAVLLRLEGAAAGAGEHVMVFVLHHLVTDAWSGGVLMREVAALYGAYREGRPSPLPALPVQYADFAHWHRRHLEGERLETLLGYWERLRGAPPLLALPTDRPRPAALSGRGATRPVALPAGLACGVRALARRCDATLFMTLLAAFDVVLHHASGQDDLVVGTDVAGRDQLETEGLIGFFINQLALRVDLAGDPTFEELVARVREVALGAFDHQHAPFEKVLDRLRPERTLAHAPLFQVKLFLINTPQLRAELPGLEIAPFGIDAGTARLDLVLALREAGDAIEGWTNFSTDLFDARTIDRLLEDFETVLRRAVETPGIRLGELAEGLGAPGKERDDMDTTQPRRTQPKKFRRIDRSAVATVSLDDGARVSTGPLSPGQELPLVVRPDGPGIDLVAWARGHRERIESWLLDHGAVLFRGFGVTSTDTFERFAGVLVQDLYEENGEHRNVGGSVFVPVFYPPDRQLLWHNENTFNATWPTKIWFCCAQAPAKGGETPIVDSRKVYRRLDAGLRSRFEERGVMYVRNYGRGLGLDWREVFRTGDRAAVEESCRKQGIEWRWHGEDGLRTWSIRPAVIAHPVTGEASWFNQAQHWHPACLDAETRASLGALYAEEDMPRTCRYGDGTPIEDAVMDEILEAYREHEVAFPWQVG